MKSDAVRPITVSLTTQQHARLTAAVQSGAYASSSEVVRDALRLWEQREQVRELELSRLKAAYEDGLASGTPRIRTADELLLGFKDALPVRG